MERNIARQFEWQYLPAYANEITVISEGVAPKPMGCVLPRRCKHRKVKIEILSGKQSSKFLAINLRASFPVVTRTNPESFVINEQ